MNLSISSIWLHEIDQTQGTAVTQTFSAESDVTDFVRNFAGKVAGLKSRRNFRFPRETVEARTLLLQIHQKDHAPTAALLLAGKLAKVEKATKERYAHLGDIQAGSLLIVFFRLEMQEYALIAKVDSLKILDKSSLKYRDGLPVDHYFMKACLVALQANTIESIVVSDSNSSISAYWWSDFLGLEAIRNNTDNTTKVFDALEKLLIRNVKPKSITDYRRMRSGVLGYLKHQPEVTYSKLVDTVFGTYEPDNDSVDTQSLIEKLESLPNTADFDTHFIVDHNVLSKKRIHAIPLTPFLELNIKDDDAILGSVKPIMEGKRKALRIYTEAGYDYFSGRVH